MATANNIVSWRNHQSTNTPRPYTTYKKTISSHTYPQKTHVSNPRTSYGVILCSEVNGDVKYALVKKRISYGVSYILKGDWKKEYFAEISNDEKDLFINVCLQKDDWEKSFMHLWTEFKGDNMDINEYLMCRDNFVNNRQMLLSEFQSSTLIFPNGVWEFPKGRMDKTDVCPKHCALRELEEETGIDRKSVKLTDLGDFHETYDKKWNSTYYVGIIRKECRDTNTTGECSELKWCSYEEAQNKIPSVMQERLSVLSQVHSKDRWIRRALQS